MYDSSHIVIAFRLLVDWSLIAYEGSAIVVPSSKPNCTCALQRKAAAEAVREETTSFSKETPSLSLRLRSVQAVRD